MRKFKIIITPILLIAFQFVQAQQKVFFINPAYKEKEAVLMPDAEGIWRAGGFEISVQKKGDNFYHLGYGESPFRSLYEGIFFTTQGQLFLDLWSIRDSVADKGYEQSYLPMHTLGKVHISKDSVYFSEWSYSWLYDLITAGKSGLNYFFNDNGIVITSSSSEIYNFLSQHGNDNSAFGKPDAFLMSGKKTIPANRSVVQATIVKVQSPTQNYPLSFPMKDGWLGADNDASIPISNNRSLWLFGDTYVGNKGQSSRDSIVTMVHSSAAITGATAEGKYTIQYYWKGMYTSQPRSLFESYTDRYVYWIKDGFIYQNDLYVLLRKVGAWPGVKAGEPFNFTLQGSSFARVRNFEKTTPDQWEEELIPFPFLYDSTFDCEQFVQEGDYIYFFLNQKNKPENLTQLIRLPVSKIDSAKNNFEYYSRSREWKMGIAENDLLTILDHEPGNTIRYHPDVKLWVMVRGPGLLNRKIIIHTSPSLTGPWSEGRTIYECPEQTPGSSIYDKNSFCYLGREHPQFYDSKKKVMLFTYDWNHTDFNTVKRNPSIYVPRIIKVPLGER